MKLYKQFRAFFAASASIGLLGAAAFLLVARWLCETVAHRALPVVGVIAPVYGLVFLSMAASNPFSSTLPCLNREGTYLACVSVAAMILVGADLSLIPHYGALGAAWGQAISTAALAILSATQFRAFARNLTYGRNRDVDHAAKMAGVSA